MKNPAVVIFSQKIVNEFAKEYPLAAYSLNRWFKQVLAADWNDFGAVKRTFNAVDFIGNDRYVFDIGGNNYWLVTMIHFRKRTVYIRFIGTHTQYDLICKKGIIKTI